MRLPPVGQGLVKNLVKSAAKPNFLLFENVIPSSILSMGLPVSPDEQKPVDIVAEVVSGKAGIVDLFMEPILSATKEALFMLPDDGSRLSYSKGDDKPLKRIVIEGKPDNGTVGQIEGLQQSNPAGIVVRGEPRKHGERASTEGIHTPYSWEGIDMHVEVSGGVSMSIHPSVGRKFAAIAMIGRVYYIDIRLLKPEHVHEVYKRPDAKYPEELEVASAVGIPPECIVGWRDTLGPFMQGNFVFNEEYIDPLTARSIDGFAERFQNYIVRLDDLMTRHAKGEDVDADMIGLRDELRTLKDEYQGAVDKVYATATESHGSFRDDMLSDGSIPKDDESKDFEEGERRGDYP